jgi:hypothetical protein
MSDESKFCSVTGCGKPIKAKGYCGNHYKKFIELPKKRAEQTALTKVAKQQQASQRMSERAAHLTMAQLEKIFLMPCKTEKDLKNYIKYFFNLHLPDCKVSRYADTTPFHAIWEVYDICVNSNNPQNVQELLYVAGRGSGKTLGMAIAELLVLLHDQRDVVHVGAILSQAKRCYEYQQKFLMSDRIKPLILPPKTQESDRILEKFTMEKSVFNVTGEKVTLEVIPCTLKACLVSSAVSADVHGKVRLLADLKPGDLIKDITGFVEVIDNQLEDAECIRIELEDGRTIEGTLDHKVWTQRGWVELQHLAEDDDVLSIDGIVSQSEAKA